MVNVAYLDMATWRMVVSIICGVLGEAMVTGTVAFKASLLAQYVSPLISNC